MFETIMMAVLRVRVNRTIGQSLARGEPKDPSEPILI